MEEVSLNASENQQSKFKFKELKVYTSIEWLYDNRKKYRQVFDRIETDYIYVELSLYNKFFDIDSWDVDIMLKCFEADKTQKSICNLSFRKKVSKYDPIVFIREGWGNKKEGSFWKKGSYYWQAFINGEAIATKYFYIEDTGSNNLSPDNYLQIQAVKFYEGHYDEMMSNERNFLIEFDVEQTKYIFTEAYFKNTYRTREWQCELFIKYYNEAGELKASTTRLQTVKAEEEFFSILSGYGANTPGSWHLGKYRVEISFLDKIIAVSHFEVSKRLVKGIPAVLLPDSRQLLPQTIIDPNNESFEDVMMKLTGLVGLTEIKQKVYDHAMYLKFLKLRQDKGFNDKQHFEIHSVFIGNPGTGKTTVAKLMGKLYHKMGLLSLGHVHVVDRSDLVGEYIGQTAPKVKEAIKKAKGGVLFIDEAYSLARSQEDTKDFGREVIELLVKEMSENNEDMAVIVAGYPKEMKTFIESNPGLNSRFKNVYNFVDYLPQQLQEIADIAANEKQVTLDVSAKSRLHEIIVEAYRNRDKSFGNARFVFDLIEQSKMNMGLRLMQGSNFNKLSNKKLQTVIFSDVVGLGSKFSSEIPNIPVDQVLLKEAILELDQLIGMEEVKREILEIVKIVQYHKSIGKNVLSSYNLHTIFIGNPGTGKTTVARILAKIYKSLGIIERGHLVETDRQGLVAGYVGQTAIKTSEKIDEAMGGVLFIDEAYALANSGSHQGDFGNEAIQTLLKRMEDDRGKFFVFVAGYPENMNNFIKMNPGLSSRFDRVLKFEDYKVDQLMEIAYTTAQEYKMKLSSGAAQLIGELVSKMFLSRDKYFGNARTVRKLIQSIIRTQNLRIADEEEVKPRAAYIITAEDVAKAPKNEVDNLYQPKGIGYSNS
ncbi:MAG: AAA family ATPase [Saprospiraceae bacterium]|nr:AAA family ATPase [Saprospiraceae bacterium]